MRSLPATHGAAGGGAVEAAAAVSAEDVVAAAATAVIVDSVAVVVVDASVAAAVSCCGFATSATSGTILGLTLLAAPNTSPSLRREICPVSDADRESAAAIDAGNA